MPLSGLLQTIMQCSCPAQAVGRAQLVGWHAQQQLAARGQPGPPSHPQSLQLSAATQAASQQQPLQEQQQCPLPDNFHEVCAWLMDKLLLNHLELCFGQHMSVVVACVVYVAAKLLQVSLTFKTVTQVCGGAHATPVWLWTPRMYLCKQT